MKTILRILLAFMLLVPAASAYAQSADGLYKEGMKLIAAAKKKQSKADVASLCEQAKAKFNGSKIVDKSTKNKNRCDKAIKEAENVKRNYPQKPSQTTKASISCDPDKLQFEATDSEQKTINVSVKGKNKEWTAETDEKGQKWCMTEIADDGETLTISCSENTETVGRQTVVTLSAEGAKKTISIYQKPAEVVISSDKAFVKFSKKAKKPEIIVVNCNSSVFDNDGFNIRTAKKPEWCDITYMPLDPKDSQSATRKWQVSIQAHPLEKSNPAYKSGRTDDLVLVSQETELVIRIDQK